MTYTNGDLCSFLDLSIINHLSSVHTGEKPAVEYNLVCIHSHTD